MKKLLFLFLLLACAVPAKATITEVTAAECAAATTTCTSGTVAAGDLVVAFAYRSGNVTAPTQPAGWTTILSSTGANTNVGRIACQVATGTSITVGTWTNATDVAVMVFRGTNAVSTANCNTTGVGTSAHNNGNTASIGYITIAMVNAVGNSWVVGCAGHATANNVSSAPTGMTNKLSAGTGPMIGCHDTNAGVTAWATTSVTVSASSGWQEYTFEVLDGSSVQHVASIAGTCTNTTMTGNFTSTCNSVGNESFTYTPLKAGDAVVLISDCSAATPAPTSVTLTGTGWTWTQVSGGIIGATLGYTAAFTAIAPNTSTTTMTITWSKSCADFIDAQTDEFAGNDQTGSTTTFEGQTSAMGTTGSCTVSMTPVTANDAAWGGCIDSVTAVKAGYLRGGDDGLEDVNEYALLVGQAGSAQTVSFTGGSGAWTEFALGIKPAGGAVVILQPRILMIGVGH